MQKKMKEELKKLMKIYKEYPFFLAVKLLEKLDTKNIELDWIIKNFDENLNFLFEKNNSIFSKKDKEILLLYYKDNLTIYEIADKFKVSFDSINKSLTQIIKKLQYPSILKYLVYGKNVEEKIDDLRTNKQYYVDNYERINSGMSNEEIEQLIVEDCKMNNGLWEERKIESSNLPLKIVNILKRNNINYAKDLIGYTKEDILNFKNLTEEDYNSLIDRLKTKELSEGFKEWLGDK